MMDLRDGAVALDGGRLEFDDDDKGEIHNEFDDDERRRL